MTSAGVSGMVWKIDQGLVREHLWCFERSFAIVSLTETKPFMKQG